MTDQRTEARPAADADDREGQRSSDDEEHEETTGEDKKKRVDRELIELLNELRVALPGVQVLFAFLLIVPFSNGYQKVTEAQRAVYFVAFICAALATALFIAPSSYHRLRFRHQDKERLLFTSNKFAIAGTGFLALSIAGVVFLITDVLYKSLVASLVTAAVAAWFAWFWYAIPISRILADQRRGERTEKFG